VRCVIRACFYIDGFVLGVASHHADRPNRNHSQNTGLHTGGLVGRRQLPAPALHGSSSVISSGSKATKAGLRMIFPFQSP
jgi:hypothetical protein